MNADLLKDAQKTLNSFLIQPGNFSGSAACDALTALSPEDDWSWLAAPVAGTYKRAAALLEDLNRW